MTPINMRKTRFLDGKKIFLLYYRDMGSARSIGKAKIQLGREAINPTTGRIVNDMAMWGSMYRWAMNNLDTSYQIFSAAMRDEGKYHTFEEWKEFIFDKADILVRHNPRTLSKWKMRIGQT
jgi:hypothetical protein